MKAHSDKDIVDFASTKEKNPTDIKNNRIDIAVDMEDEHGTAHTYVVNFCRNSDGSWEASDVSELSSL